MVRWISTQIKRFRFNRGVASGHLTNIEILGPPNNF